jgi:hypothetical protein
MTMIASADWTLNGVVMACVDIGGYFSPGR